MDHAAALQCNRPVGQGEREIELLVDDDERNLAPEAVEALMELVDGGMRETLERLAAEQEGHGPTRARATPPSAACLTARPSADGIGARARSVAHRQVETDA